MLRSTRRPHVANRLHTDPADALQIGRAMPADWNGLVLTGAPHRQSIEHGRVGQFVGAAGQRLLISCLVPIMLAGSRQLAAEDLEERL